MLAEYCAKMGVEQPSHLSEEKLEGVLEHLRGALELLGAAGGGGEISAEELLKVVFDERKKGITNEQLRSMFAFKSLLIGVDIFPDGYEAYLAKFLEAQ